MLRKGVPHDAHHVDLFYGAPSPGNERARERFERNRFVRTAARGHVTKCWTQSVRIDRRPTSIGLGRYPVVTLALPRQRELENAQAIAEGRDPRRRAARAVPHGFRSSFRDWAAECTEMPREVCELALAHVNSDRVEAAYRRSDLFERRRTLMQQWADYLAGPN